jgi:L-threonylcarbamoyladenylate synthase
MPAVPLVVIESDQRGPEELLSEINARLRELPDEVEGIQIKKPAQGIQSYQILHLSPDPVMAAREFYSELRRLGESGFDSILFFREGHQTGPHWENLFDRLYKAASLILK